MAIVPAGGGASGHQGRDCYSGQGSSLGGGLAVMRERLPPERRGLPGLGGESPRKDEKPKGKGKKGKEEKGTKGTEKK